MRLLLGGLGLIPALHFAQIRTDSLAAADPQSDTTPFWILALAEYWRGAIARAWCGLRPSRDGLD